MKANQSLLISNNKISLRGLFPLELLSLLLLLLL